MALVGSWVIEYSLERLLYRKAGVCHSLRDFDAEDCQAEPVHSWVVHCTRDIVTL